MDKELVLKDNTSSKTEHLITGNSVAGRPNTHQVFYLGRQGLNFDVTYKDLDDNGYPFGLLTDMQTGEAGIGLLTLTVVHRPDKTASGVSNGDMTNAGGSTDLQVDFEIRVED